MIKREIEEGERGEEGIHSVSQGEGRGGKNMDILTNLQPWPKADINYMPRFDPDAVEEDVEDEAAEPAAGMYKVPYNLIFFPITHIFKNLDFLSIFPTWYSTQQPKY